MGIWRRASNIERRGSGSFVRLFGEFVFVWRRCGHVCGAPRLYEQSSVSKGLRLGGGRGLRHRTLYRARLGKLPSFVDDDNWLQRRSLRDERYCLLARVTALRAIVFVWGAFLRVYGLLDAFRDTVHGH